VRIRPGRIPRGDPRDAGRHGLGEERELAVGGDAPDAGVLSELADLRFGPAELEPLQGVAVDLRRLAASGLGEGTRGFGGVDPGHEGDEPSPRHAIPRVDGFDLAAGGGVDGQGDG
jgi:hypothetical protein